MASPNDVFSAVEDRLYSEKEVREILQEAASSQSSHLPQASTGISLEELKQVGRELGFEPRNIELAAKQLGVPAPAKFALISPRIVLDRTIDGEVSPDDWQGMVGVIQRYHKDVGAVSQRGSTYDWTGSEEGASLALTVQVKNGRSRIHLESNRWSGIFAASVSCTMAAFVLTMFETKHAHPLFALAACLLAAALWFGLTRFFHRNHHESAFALLERLVDEAQTESSSRTLESAIQDLNIIPRPVEQVRA